MAGRGGRTFRGVGRRKIRIRRQPMGRRKVTRLSKSNHITDLSVCSGSHMLFRKGLNLWLGKKPGWVHAKGLRSALEDPLLAFSASAANDTGVGLVSTISEYRALVSGLQKKDPRLDRLSQMTLGHCSALLGSHSILEDGPIHNAATIVYS